MWGCSSFHDRACHFQNFLQGQSDKVENDGSLAAPLGAAGPGSTGGDIQTPG